MRANAEVPLKGQPFLASIEAQEPQALDRALSAVPVLSDTQTGIRRNIIGTDDRQPATDATQPYWRMVCQLVIESTNGHSYTGTGWLAGPYTVVTAGHNLQYDAIGHVAKRVWVIPGREGDVGRFGVFECTAFDAHASWKQGQRPGFDIGVIWLPQPAGKTLGYFGYASFPDAALANTEVATSGYPEDKPAGTQWLTQSRVVALLPHVLRYGLDTVPGQSGSPVFQVGPAGPVVVAVHVYGTPQVNEGVRIASDIVLTLNNWWR